MKTAENNNRREPADEYDCWTMDCRGCVYWRGERQGCEHPELYLDPTEQQTE